MEGTSGSWCPLFFAEGRAERPSAPDVSARATPGGPAVPTLSGVGPCGETLATLESPAGARGISRREVSERIELGKDGQRVLGRARGSRRTWPRPRPDLARETSAGRCRRPRAGPRPRSMAEGSATRARWREIVRRGFGHAVDAGERSARARAGPVLHIRHGDQVIGGGARGSRWLQKSTSGARSRPKGSGSSSPAPRASGRARGAKARRKPGRGGESHLRASSDTGGGLSLIPRVPAPAACVLGGGSTRRWKASWRGSAVVFDETASGPGRRPEAMGMRRFRAVAQALPGMTDPPRAHEDVRGRVASPSCGREHRRREAWRGGAFDRGSTRTAPGHARDRTEPRFRTIPSSEGDPPRRASREGCGRDRSWRFAVKRGSTWQLTRWARPGIERSAGCSWRESVAEVGETHLSRGARGPRCRRRQGGTRERGVARGDPSAFDEADQGSRRATGCGARQRT
jgi:hypothetical protein